MQQTPINQRHFQRLLARNIALPLGIGLLSCVFFIAVIFYLLSIDRWIERTDLLIGQANQVEKLLIDQETGLRGYLLTDSEDFLQPYSAALAQIAPELNKLRELAADEPQQRYRATTIYNDYLDWSRYASDTIASKRANKSAEVFSRSDGGKVIMDKIRQQTAALIALGDTAKNDKTASAKRIVFGLIIGFSTLSLLFSALLAYIGRRDLQLLSNTYVDLLEEERHQNAQLQDQAWSRSGKTQLADYTVGQLPPSILGHKTLEFLAQYVGAVVGAFYVVQNESLTRIAQYAFSREGEPRQLTIQLGEGLVGQAAVNRQLISLKEVPPGYLQINSALGSGTPKSVIVVPTMAEGEVNAVIELGFPQPLSQRTLDFLPLIAVNIGAAIEAANYRLRLQTALTQTQDLNSELQTQQEELRVAFEELEEQAQALEESQARLEHQQSELERSNDQLVRQADAMERQRDALRENNEALNHAQQLLEERALEVEQASRYKSEFLANMSHELRTPLNSALILSNLLAENASGNLNPDQIQYAQSIHAAGKDLLALINDVLDISKVEAGKLEIIPEQINLRKFIDAVATHFEPLAKAKGLTFRVECAQEVPQAVFTDRQRLRQILNNLLSNAIKFTAQGSVGINVAQGIAGTIDITISDTGIGIDPSQHEIIFEAFAQGDGTTNRRYGGTGLGLSISRNLASLLGGQIDVDSSMGQGSSFRLNVPTTYDEPKPLTKASPARRFADPPSLPNVAPKITVETAFEDDRATAQPGERTILVVEDEPSFAKILYDLALEHGYQCVVAPRANEGFTAALKYRPHAILLDMKLPDYSGLALLERLKDNSITRHIPVHVISVEDRAETALQLGAIGYLLKPASFEQLKGIFTQLESRFAHKLRHVLLVESDATQRDNIAQLIQDVDVEITSVASGAEALTHLRERTFDCMIMDLQLPDMPGSELLQHMASAESYSFPAVIVYTEHNLSKEEEAALLKYSRSIIIKGVRSPERLLDEVTLFLHKVEADLPLDRQHMLQTARSRDKAFEGRKILVVDDDVRNIFALTSALEHKGALVEIGRNGLDALSQLDSDDSIDLVLMDIMMPEMDGYTAIAQIRKNPRFNRLPIIAVTAKAMRDDQERCLRAGANDYLAKPIDVDRLLSLIRVWLPKMQRI